MENKKIKVAQIIGTAGGGVEAVILNYYKFIDQTKVQFDFFVDKDSSFVVKNKIKEFGGKVYVIPSYLHPFKYMKRLEKLFRKEKYDIVHSNMNTLSVFALRAAKRAGIKIRIAHSHSTANNKEVLKTIIKNLLRPFSKRYATHYFACSELAGKWLFGKDYFEKGKITIINNAVDIERFKYNDELREKTRKVFDLKDKFVIGHIGRFVPQKNHLFLLEVFKEILVKKENAVLFLIGDGPLHNEVIERSKKLDIYDKIIFLAVQKDPSRFYQAMDCFILPSLYEGLPVVGIEAQVNGLNLFYSDTITSELVVNQNVYSFNLADDKRTIAERIISAPEIDRSNGYLSFVNTKYDISIEAKKLLEAYEKIVNDN